MQLALESGASILPDSKEKTMASRTDNQPRVSLPVWVFPLLLSILIAFLTNLGYSLVWVGQIGSNQSNMVNALNEVKSEVRELRGENQKLREQVAALTAAGQPRR